MMRLVAQHADIWNGWLVFGQNHPNVVPPLRDAVDAACAELERDPSTLRRTVAIDVALLGRDDPEDAPLRGEPEQLAAALHAFALEGITEVEIGLRPNTLAGIEAFAPVLALLDGA
jgi:alkanesulfonate monooxygenase SsuD/methylene tetrahydromethanopterin reductase-like flavin-dependent oxidoreductase (luciferase family)